MSRSKRCSNFLWVRIHPRQEYIIRNLRFEHDLVKDEESQNEEADGPGSAPEKNAVTAKEGVVERQLPNFLHR